MNRPIATSVVLGAVVLLCTGVASADAGATPTAGDLEFINSLLEVLTTFIESLQSLLAEAVE
jgi:hypothetical protein